MSRLPRFLAILWLALLGVAGWAPLTQAFDGLPPPVAVGDLPREVQHTLGLIKHNGPFRYERDGIEFRNFERRLPKAPRAYYREYTVRTPGERSRGARRIIAGGAPPEVYYYTDDHYNSFRRIVE